MTQYVRTYVYYVGRSCYNNSEMSYRYVYRSVRRKMFFRVGGGGGGEYHRMHARAGQYAQGYIMCFSVCPSIHCVE